MWLSILSLLLMLVPQTWAEDAHSIMKSLESTTVDTATQTLSLTIQKGPNGKEKQYTMQTQMRRETDAIYCHAGLPVQEC